MTGRTGDWRPISTAPKDGTRVLVYQPEGCWQSSPRRHGRGEWSDVAYWHQPGNPEVRGFWIGDYVLRPTHWMPLPQAPDAGGQGEEG